jgi:hypothetical protein
MAMVRPDSALDRLACCVDEHADGLVREYFDPSNGFAAATFDTLGNNPANALTRDDLLALTCLDEHAPPAALRWFDSKDGRAKMTELLTAIDEDTELGEDSDAAALAAADAAWQFLVHGDLAGIGPVIAGKLLARKRPALIPIVDRVVKSVVHDETGHYWSVFRDFMTDHQRRERLAELHSLVDDADVSDLRVLDAAVWMRGSGSRNAYVVRDRLGVPDLPWAPRPSGGS